MQFLEFSVTSHVRKEHFFHLLACPMELSSALAVHQSHSSILSFPNMPGKHFYSWKHYLHTLYWLSLASMLSPQPSSLHSFPRGAWSFLPSPKDQRGEVWGTRVTCLVHWALSGEQLSCMNSTGRSSKWRKAAHREQLHLCVKEGSFTDTTGHVPYYSPALGPDDYSSTSKAIHPAASASPCTEPQQWSLPCYCTGAFSGSISLVFMQNSIQAVSTIIVTALQMATALTFSRYAPLTIYKDKWPMNLKMHLGQLPPAYQHTFSCVNDTSLLNV